MGWGLRTAPQSEPYQVHPARNQNQDSLCKRALAATSYLRGDVLRIKGPTRQAEPEPETLLLVLALTLALARIRFVYDWTRFAYDSHTARIHFVYDWIRFVYESDTSRIRIV